MNYHTTGGRCSECRQEFEGWHRYNQTTCSPKCRKARQRRIEANELAMSNCMIELGRIRDGIKRRERVPEFIAELQRLKGEINDLLLLAGEKDTLSKHAMLSDWKEKRS